MSKMGPRWPLPASRPRHLPSLQEVSVSCPPASRERYPYFGVPPAREPRPAADEPALQGKRVILSTPEGFVYDMRAVSRIYKDGDGRERHRHPQRRAYYRWMFTKVAPEATPYAAHLVWVE